jgi:hypothetical protein
MMKRRRPSPTPRLSHKLRREASRANNWWFRHRIAMLVSSVAVVCFCGGTAYAVKVQQLSSANSQVGGLSVALAAQQDEALSGGTKVVTPPTSVIVQHPEAATASASATPHTVDNDALQDYVNQLFIEFVASHPPAAINYVSLKNYILTNVKTYLAQHPASAGPSGASGAPGSPGPSGASGAPAQIDYTLIQSYISQAVAAYELSHPNPSPSSGATGESGAPGPACTSGFQPAISTAPNGGSIEVCSSSPVPSESAS